MISGIAVYLQEGIPIGEARKGLKEGIPRGKNRK